MRHVPVLDRQRSMMQRGFVGRRPLMYLSRLVAGSASPPQLTSSVRAEYPQQFSSTPMLFARGRGRGRGRGRVREPQVGDWTCTCGEVNYRSRRECPKCNAPAPPLPLGMSRPKLPGEDPHDWACPCGKMNFRQSVNCFKCKMPKPVAPGQESGNGMWKCNRCKSIQRVTKKHCLKCLAPQDTGTSWSAQNAPGVQSFGASDFGAPSTDPFSATAAPAASPAAADPFSVPQS